VVRADLPRAGRIPVGAGEEDKPLTAILKWIPVEIIGTYKFVMGFIPADAEAWRLTVTILTIPLTAGWIAFATTPEAKRIAWRQVILSPFAFACWVAAIQGDVMLDIVSGWKAWMGSVILAAGTVLLPILDGILRRLDVRQN
jgi:hypothetical protein